MTTWRPGPGGIFHAYESWKPIAPPGAEARHIPACGSEADDAALDPDGRWVCIVCRRKFAQP